MRNQLGDEVGVIVDLEVEAPAPVDAGLPAVDGFILPRWNAKLTRSPLDGPAWRRTLVGMVTCPLCWILAVVFTTKIPRTIPEVRNPDFCPVAQQTAAMRYPPTFHK